MSEVEHFAGERVFEANPKIVEFMREKGVLLFSEDYEHRYPHCWRCKNPVIFRATPQWFISMDLSASSPHAVFEKDEDGRDRSNFTDNLAENETEASSDSLRAGALREIENVEWIPAWGVDRMRNMFKGRPDWCVSRQRVWGVPIPAFYCSECNEAVADPVVVNHVADIFEKESSDAWYARKAIDLLPEGFKCLKCGGADWTKETDILDVWFDSGSSSIAVLKQREELRWPADVYLEGGDQYRGWFNSSLMVGLAAENRAPYKAVITHGWVINVQGLKMSKSEGTGISPNEVVKDSGAEILRLWVASSNYQEDVRCSDEILKHVSEAYRKMRNTARFALGNLDGFNPSLDSVPDEELLEIDAWALAELDHLIFVVREAYKKYEFHIAYHSLYYFCSVTLSARYFDIIKDRLYTAAPKSAVRRAAQTVLYKITHALTRLLAPLMAFTTDEIWEQLPRAGTDDENLPSVHLAEFPPEIMARDAQGRDVYVRNLAEIGERWGRVLHAYELKEHWSRLFKIRDIVLRALEEARGAKLIGSSLEARVNITANENVLRFLSHYKKDLRYIFIVSQVDLARADEANEETVLVNVEHAEGEKCERCWNYSTRVGESSRYPTACERCVEALAEIEREDAV